MARRSRMSILKRQRELKKAEKAASKRARRHGKPEPMAPEPVPTVGIADLMRGKPSEDDSSPAVKDEGRDGPEADRDTTD